MVLFLGIQQQYMHTTYNRIGMEMLALWQLNSPNSGLVTACKNRCSTRALSTHSLAGAGSDLPIHTLNEYHISQNLLMQKDVSHQELIINR